MSDYALEEVARQMALANLLEWHKQLDHQSAEAQRVRDTIRRSIRI